RRHTRLVSDWSSDVCSSDLEDYVVKPFSPRELMLRVKAILARTLKPVETCIQVGAIQIYPSEHRVLIDDQEVSLTQTEFKILLRSEERRVGKECRTRRSG